MKFYKPLFSIVIILIQLTLSIKEYYKLQEWKIANPELDAIVSLYITYDSLFLFVFIIGIYEMLTKPSWFKTVIRIFLVCIILGTEFSDSIPIDLFYYGVYNTAWFSAVVAIVLILVRIGKYSFGKINDRKRNKASR
jgi:hypothetical protein